MSTKKLDLKSQLMKKVAELEFSYFTLPIYDIEVKYRRLDPIEGSLNGTFPNWLAEPMIQSMRSSGNYRPDEEQVDFSTASKDVHQLLLKSMDAWLKYVVDPILTKEELETLNKDAIIGWFLYAAFGERLKTINGVEVGPDQVLNFPEE